MRKRWTSQRRERNRALAAGVLLLLACACGLYFASHSIRTSDDIRDRVTAAVGNGSGTAQSSSTIAGTRKGDDDLTTGSILFVPSTGNVCRQRLIDNRSWLIRDGGYVKCDEAVSWHTGGGPRKTYTRTSRVEAIREGFFRK